MNKLLMAIIILLPLSTIGWAIILLAELGKIPPVTP